MSPLLLLLAWVSVLAVWRNKRVLKVKAGAGVKEASVGTRCRDATGRCTAASPQPLCQPNAVLCAAAHGHAHAIAVVNQPVELRPGLISGVCSLANRH